MEAVQHARLAAVLRAFAKTSLQPRQKAPLIKPGELCDVIDAGGKPITFAGTLEDATGTIDL